MHDPGQSDRAPNVSAPKATALSRRAGLADHFESLEPRLALSAAFDITGLTALRADPAYAQIDGSGVAVAILDSGVFGAHPDLTGNFVGWYDVVTPANTTSKDPNGHGTHVAGTVASTNPAIGVAPQAKIVGVRTLPSQGDPELRQDPVAAALTWVLQNYAQHNIKVINMSLQSKANYNGDAPANEEGSIIAELERVGITVVSASGNDYANWAAPGMSTPAIWSTLAVESTWEDDGVGDQFPDVGGTSFGDWVAADLKAKADRLAAYSQRSTRFNQIAAPGSTIYSTWNGAQGKMYNTIAGTSMASPFVAGVAALMQDAAKTFGGRYLSPAEVRQIMRDTADVLFDSPTTENGRVKRDGSSTQVENLPELNGEVRRVNVQRAIIKVREVVTGTLNAPPPVGAPDLNGTTATATAVPSLDATQAFSVSNKIGYDGTNNVGNADIDVFKLVLESPGELTFKITLPTGGTSFSPALRLFNSSGVAEFFSALGSGYRSYTTSAKSSGTYYVGISADGNATYNVISGAGRAAGNSTGDFSLEINLSNPDPNGVAQGAVAYRGLPDVFNGFIGADYGEPVGSQDVDMFEIFIPDTGTLRIDIDAQDKYGNNAVDSFIRVFDENLVEIASNDDEGTGLLDSLLVLGPAHIQRGRRIFVAVSDFSNRNFSVTNPYDRTNAGPGGYYDLKLDLSNGDANGIAAEATVITIGTAVNGTIGQDANTTVGADGSKDVDFYIMSAAASGVLDVQVNGNAAFQSGLIFWKLDEPNESFYEIGRAYGPQSRLLLKVQANDVIWASVTGLGNEQFKWYGVGTGTGGATGTYSMTTTLRAAGAIGQFTNDSVQNATPTPLTLDSVIGATIGQDGPAILEGTDIDVYTFVAPLSGYIAFRTDLNATSDAGLGTADTFLRVFDSAGNEITFNDDANAKTTGSKIVLKVVQGTTYYIGVNGYSAQSRNYNVLTGANPAAGSTGVYGIVATQADIFIADPNSRQGVAAGSDGSSAVSALSATGRPIVFSTTDGLNWTVADLKSKTSAPTGAGSPATWVDAKDGFTYAATISTTGSLLLFKYAQGVWTFRELTGPANISGLTSNLTSLTARDGTVYLGVMRSNGDFVLFTQSGGNPGDYQWSAINLTADQFSLAGITSPAITGQLVSYVTSWNGLNFAGLDAAGNVHSIWWAPGQTIWTASNLTQITGAPKLAGGLTTFVTSWDNVNIVGATSAGEIITTWWLPSFGGDWKKDSLTSLFSGPALQAASVTSYITPWDGMNVAGLNSAGKLVIYWWAPAFGSGAGWQIASITDLISGATPIVGSVTGLAAPLQGAAQTPGPITIAGKSAAGNVSRYFWSPGTNAWAQQDLSSAALPG